MRTALPSLTAALTFGVVAGCSLINSFDEVKPESTESSGGRSGSGGRDGSGGDDASASGGSSDGGSNSGGTSGAGGTEPTSGGTNPGTGGVIDDGGDEDVFVPGGDTGVIVAYEPKKGTTPGHLVVIDPADGAVLDSEDMASVRGIANDFRTDLWYIFEQTGAVNEALTLHVRELNVDSGKWREVGTVKGVPYPASRPQAMNGRLAYLSLPNPAAVDQGTFTLTVLNTVDPSKVAVVGTPNLGLPKGLKVGITVAGGTTVGGDINILILDEAADCTAGDAGTLVTCGVDLVRYIVNNGGVAPFQQGAPAVQVRSEVGRVIPSGIPTFAADIQGPYTLIALPVTDPATEQGVCQQTTAKNGQVVKFDMRTLRRVGAVFNVPTESDRFSGVAYDRCFDSLFLGTQVLDPALSSIPISGGAGAAAAKQCLPAGGTMVIEPYTRTLVRATTGGGLAFYSLVGSATAPKVSDTSVPKAKLPSSFTPSLFAVRDIDRNRVPCP